MSWRKLNYLVPDPECSTLNGVITDWKDARPQPTEAEIDAVDINDVIAKEAETEEDNFDFPDVLKTIAKALHNHENRIRTLEGKSTVSLKQVVKALRAL